MIIEELLVKLGFFADLKALEAFSAKVIGIKKQLTYFLGAIEGAALAVSGFFGHALTDIDEQAKFARQVGITVQQLQELQYAAKLSGGSVEDLDSSLRAVSKSIFEASEGVGGGIEVFGRLGIATTGTGGKLRSTIDVLSQIADKFKSLPNEEQQDFAAKIGISNSTLLLLQKGSAGIAELRKQAQELGVYTKEDADKAEAYAESWRSLTQVFTVLRNQLAIGLSPVFTGIVKDLTAWLVVNRQLIISGFTDFIKLSLYLLTALFKTLGFIITVLKGVIDAFGGLRNVLEVLAISTGLIAIANLPRLLSLALTGVIALRNGFLLLWAAINPTVVALTVLIAALALAIQDIWVWAHGGDSLFGRLLDKAPRLRHELQLYHRDFIKLGETMNLIADYGTRIGNAVHDALINSANAIKDYFFGIIDSIEHKLEGIENFFLHVGKKTKDLFTGNQGQNPTSPLLQQVPLTNGNQITNVVNNINNSKQSAIPNVTNKSNVTINVNGSHDPHTVAKTVQKTLYDATRQAHRYNTNTVAL